MTFWTEIFFCSVYFAFSKAVLIYRRVFWLWRLVGQCWSKQTWKQHAAQPPLRMVIVRVTHVRRWANYPWPVSPVCDTLALEPCRLIIVQFGSIIYDTHLQKYRGETAYVIKWLFSSQVIWRVLVFDKTWLWRKLRVSSPRQWSSASEGGAQ